MNANELLDKHKNRLILSFREASVSYTMIKLAAKPSCVSSSTGDNRTIKLVGALSLVSIDESRTLNVK